MKISESEMLLTKFWESDCDGECETCSFSTFCAQSYEYMKKVNILVNKNKVIKLNENLEVMN